MSVLETSSRQSKGLRRTLYWVLTLNASFFFIEASIAAQIGSVSLFADSVDFLEDASINALVLLALGATALWRQRAAIVLAALILVPGIAALWTAAAKLANPTVPDAYLLTATGLAALVVNTTCVMLLRRVQDDGGALTLAAFLSARNDLISNAAIITAGLVTMVWVSMVPDLVVGLLIAWINADAALDVYRAARRGDGEAPLNPQP
jgi:Co/Zn/Cd efflux system component